MYTCSSVYDVLSKLIFLITDIFHVKINLINKCMNGILCFAKHLHMKENFVRNIINNLCSYLRFKSFFDLNFM